VGIVGEAFRRRSRPGTNSSFPFRVSLCVHVALRHALDGVRQLSVEGTRSLLLRNREARPGDRGYPAPRIHSSLFGECRDGFGQQAGGPRHSRYAPPSGRPHRERCTQRRERLTSLDGRAATQSLSTQARYVVRRSPEYPRPRHARTAPNGFAAVVSLALALPPHVRRRQSHVT